jgi:hypothetical protein
LFHNLSLFNETANDGSGSGDVIIESNIDGTERILLFRSESQGTFFLSAWIKGRGGIPKPDEICPKSKAERR